MKIVLLTLLFISTSALTACFPANFAAESTPKNTANAAENDRQSSSVETETKKLKAENSVKKPETNPTPKPKTAVDNFVCPEPNLPCMHKQKQFADWELSFRMPAKLIANKTYKSAPFYAVILKKYEEGCDELDENPAVEPERKRIQKLFSSRKVFAEYSCPNMDAVNYDFAGKLSADGERFLYMDYIAVYAGVDETEGKEIFDLLKKDYPQAELKKMTAQYGIIEQ